jgi:hypothetical protein
MMQILVKFNNQPVLICEIKQCLVGRQFFQLCKQNYTDATPVFRDPMRYTDEYMRSLCQRARDELGWRWGDHDLASGIGAWLHKDLETLLVQGFANIPEQFDELVHELHYGLHLRQHGTKLARTSWLQIEWYNDDGFALDEDFVFDPVLKFGEIRLQNPYVGHGPLQMYQESDYINIAQTCKFHDFVKPGFNIAMIDYSGVPDLDWLIEQFRNSDPDFVARHGEHKIRHYTGYPIIGKVLNLDDLDRVKKSTHLLELEKLEFIDD